MFVGVRVFAGQSDVRTVGEQSRTLPESGWLAYLLAYIPLPRTTAGSSFTPVREQDAERIALDIIKRADAAGERVTLGMVERRLAELLSHPPDCRCGVCQAAGEVTARGVNWVAANWQSQIAVTRRRAAR